MKHIIALSGGKDSSAMALALSEFEPRDYEYICTPTGNELPQMSEHWAKLERLLGKPIVRLQQKTLFQLIDEMQMLPNWQARWCTRILKIEPSIDYMQSLPPGSIMYVGLRADEEERAGIFGEDLTLDFPMRRWGWDEVAVWQYLTYRGVTIPNRSDCAVCFYQRLGEWFALWKKHPEEFEAGAAIERRYGHTFRSDGRDTWPAAMDGLRAEFEKGRIPRGAEAAMQENGACRVCRL